MSVSDKIVLHMKKLTDIQREKIKLGLELLFDSNTDLDKIQKVAQMLRGLNRSIDRKLESITNIIDKIQKIQDGNVVNLSAQNLPEQTDKQKKKKKLILLLLTHWKDLKSEIVRINELQVAVNSANGLNQTSAVKAGKIAVTAKGPLGVITIIAVGIVAVGTLLNNKSVNVNVQNVGCGPLGPFTKTAINIPGLKIPSEAIVSGRSNTIKMLPLDINVNAINRGYIDLTALNYSQKIDLPSSIKDIIYDGKSIIGKETLVNLSSSKSHDLIIKCK